MDQQICTINAAINAIKVLRTSVSNVFEVSHLKLIN